MSVPKVAGQLMSIRIMQSIHNQKAGRFSHVDVPSEEQVAMVFHALADHTAIMEALKHRPDPTSPWPEATSVGRWLHDVGDSLEINKKGI